MRGVITRAEVLAHPILIIEAFGVKVLVRALFASARETFLEVVSRCAEEEAHRQLEELGLVPAVERFIGLERRVGDVYRRLSARFSGDAEVAEFFRMLSGQEEGHAIVLFRVRREVRRGRLWKASKDLHLADVEAIEDMFDAYTEEVGRGVTLERALEIVELVEGSEINVVFDTLKGCVDMRSRRRFERFFGLAEGHLEYCREQLERLRARRGIATG